MADRTSELEAVLRSIVETWTNPRHRRQDVRYQECIRLARLALDRPPPSTTVHLRPVGEPYGVTRVRFDDADAAIRANHLLMVKWCTAANDLAAALESIRDNSRDPEAVSIAATALEQHREAVGDD